MERILVALALMIGGCAAGAFANYTATQGSGTTFNSFDVGGVKAPGMVITDAATGATDVGAAILAAAQAAIPAGANLIGKVGVDQTTPGTTNAVATIAGQNGVAGGSGVVGATTQRTVLATDVALPIGGNRIGYTSDDPCSGAATKVSVPISQTANTKLFSQVSAKKNYICSIIVNGSDAENISLVEGTGSTCGTSTAAIIGGTTAATGMNFAANGGFARGNGNSFIAAGANNNFDVCLFQSGSGRVAGVLTYVQQ